MFMAILKQLIAKILSYFDPKPTPIVVKPKPSDPTNVVTKSLSQNAYEIAKTQLGVEEVDGDGNNKIILKYHQATDLKADEDAVPWCSSFMNWCIQSAGGKGTRNAMARSWLNWGKTVLTPKEGDTVIFSSPLRGPSAGHVAFYVSHVPVAGYIKVLGGNQQDAVSYELYPTANVLGYRRSTDG